MNPFDTLIVLALIISGACALLACLELGAKLVRYCRLTLKSLAWSRRERGYMARWMNR